MRLGHRRTCVHGLLRRLERHGLDRGLGRVVLAAVREHGLDAALPRVLQVVQVQRLAAGLEHVILAGHADLTDLHQVRDLGQFGVVVEFDEERAVGRGEQVVDRDRRIEPHTDAVAERHLEQRLGRRAVARRGDGDRVMEVDEVFDHRHRGQQTVLVRGQAVVQIARRDAHDAVAGLLELGGGGVAHVAHRHGEGDQRRRHVEILEAAAHRILASDRADAQVGLRHQRAEHRGHRLAPAGRIILELAEILLEAQVRLLMLETGGHQLGERFDNRQVRAGELVALTDVRVEAPGHGGGGGGLAEHQELGDHRHIRGQLPAAAERHQHGRRADRGVEALGQALVRGHVDVGDQRVHALRQRAGHPRAGVAGPGLHMHVHMLGRAIRIEELAGQAHDHVAVPGHLEGLLLGDGGDDGGLQVLLTGVAQELVHILGGDGHGHALLGFGDRQLGAVQALVLLGHGVQIDVQAVGDLTGGHGHAAGAEVVAALDQTAGVAAAEQTLQLALDRGVALLHLGAAILQALHILRLGGAGGAADAVTAGAAAEQDDLVAGRGALAAHVVGGRGAHDGADLHALGHVAGVVELADLPGGQADLVAVAGVAGGGGGHELALRELAGHGLGHGDRGVGRAGHAHGLVDVAAAGERVADGAADAGRRSAERLDLGRVVVGLVLEQEQPVLVLAVHVDGHPHGAGVDLFGLVEVLELAGLLQVLGADGAHVHEAHRLLVAAELMADLHVAIEGGLHHRVVDLHLVEHGAEGGVAAVVGPVGVDHADLGDGGVAMLAAEVLLAKRDVRLVHGKAQVGDHRGQPRLVELAEAVKDLDRLGIGDLGGERLGLVERGDARLDRVHHVVLDGLDVVIGELAGEDVDLGGAHDGALALADELDALACGVGALVELAGKELHREHGGAGHLGQLIIGDVDLGLGEHHRRAAREQLLVGTLDVVAVEEAEPFEARDAQDAHELGFELCGLDVKARLLLHIDALDH